MEQNTKATGKIIKQVDKVFFGMLKVMYTREISKMIKPTDMECILALMEPDMKETGLMMLRLVRDRQTGQMALATKAITRMDLKMDMECIFGPKEISTKEIGKLII